MKHEHVMKNETLDLRIYVLHAEKSKILYTSTGRCILLILLMSENHSTSTHRVVVSSR